MRSRNDEVMPRLESGLALDDLWLMAKFDPHPKQKAAILHGEGPLYLPAGPGSGKTRVLLWRVLKLLVFDGLKPDEVFLSTFTEKAALQLKEGLRTLLGFATEKTGAPYDLSRMYVGTVHSLCQRLLSDRRFSVGNQRPRPPVLLDELDQYLFLRRRRNWSRLLEAGEITRHGPQTVNAWFNVNSRSRHVAISNCIGLFNRLSEECIDPKRASRKAKQAGLSRLIKMYGAYRSMLGEESYEHVDFPLVQQKALDVLNGFPDSHNVFKYVIVDEYQDTNTIQERLYFKLAGGHHNICVVGDDDQALYRFRGATVENFVEFPDRCRQHLKRGPRTVFLDANYRSRKLIVNFYKDFMAHPTCDWRKRGRPLGSYRVQGKDIKAERKDDGPSVVASTPARPEAVTGEIAELIRAIVDEKKVQDPNQIAFLFPSLGSPQVKRMRAALEAKGLKVYAPRAGRFLGVDEALAMFGCFFRILGKPDRGSFAGQDYQDYYDWVDSAFATAKRLTADDALLARYVSERHAEVERTARDHRSLRKVADARGWDLGAVYDPDTMRQALFAAAGLSPRAVQILKSSYFHRAARRRLRAGHSPFKLRYAITRAASLDWTILDLFYQLCGFRHFREMFDLAERGEDEGPICNLSLVSQYLSRYLESYPPLISGEWLQDRQFLNIFNSYLYVLFRRGESEYEDAEDPFPKGRIPFITVHQAKGLEFPVVVLANPRKKDKEPQELETMVRPLLERNGEPLDRMAQFDVMRMFYVALSRAKNLLVLAHWKGQGNWVNEPFASMLDAAFPRIGQFDIKTLPPATMEKDDLPRTYSYTGDYLLYKRCPRQYMIFRRYNFAPSRSQTMFFGSLVHQTLEDLHQFLIGRRRSG